MALLDIQHVDKHYGGIHALDDVSLIVETGTVVGLVGDNGAGKSTLMKCITGAERQDDGTIVFDGEQLNPSDPHHSRKAGIEMIYQNLNLCPQLDVVSNIFLGRELCKTPWPFLNERAMQSRVHDILGTLNADIDLKAFAGKLSGGQQQAVAIARAMTFEPKLVIMDEPTAALGVREVQKVLTLIKNLRKQDIAVIVISHRLTDIFEVADRIVFMRRGTVREDKPASDLTLPQLTEMLVS